MKRVIAILFVSGLPVVIAFLLENPDAVNRLKMSTALRIKKHADVQSYTWGQVSAKAATVYQKARL